MKNKTRKIFLRILFVVGIFCCAYPLGASIYEGYIQRNVISTYSSEVDHSDEAKRQEILKDARAYNDKLWQSQGGLVGDVDIEFYSDANYKKQLKFGNSDVMAQIEIPKINVDLPIYHGTDEETLKIGVGHLQNSSLPVGGENTRSILTGHRGLPNSKLFTRLDELKEGDLFYITTAGEKLAYKINDITVIEPTDVGMLDTVPGKDQVSLITCTPYGLNTHRLVVTGERVPYNELERDSITSGGMSIREIIFALLPFIFLALGLGHYVIDFVKKHKRKEKGDAGE